MAAEVFLYLLAGWSPYGHPPAFAFPQLPTEAQCELCHRVCESDRARIVAELEIACGWRRVQLLEQRHDADRTLQTWYAAWWLTWSRATPEQQDEWGDILTGYVGLEDFWRGNLPLPLSLR